MAMVEMNVWHCLINLSYKRKIYILVCSHMYVCLYIYA